MIDKIKKLGAKYNLTTIQLAHFAGQLSHESFDFKITLTKKTSFYTLENRLK